MAWHSHLRYGRLRVHEHVEELNLVMYLLAEGQEPELATALYTNSDGAKYWSCPSCTFENALVRTNATASGQRVVCELCFRSAVLIPTP